MTALGWAVATLLLLALFVLGALVPFITEQMQQMLQVLLP